MIMAIWARIEHAGKYRRAKTKYESDLASYPAALRSFKSEQSNVTRQRAMDEASLRAPAAVQAYRSHRVAEALASVEPPTPLHPSEVPRAGATDLWFYGQLRTRFGPLVLRDVTLRVDDEYDLDDDYDLYYSAYPFSRTKKHARRTFRRPYVPDVVYFNRETGVAIDIEIDEPYRLDTHEPIHIIGMDEDRNQFFLDNGWGVIRFAEEQVLKYPEGCCQLIARVAERIATGSTNLPKARMELVEQWDKTMARRAAKERSRESLLISRGLMSDYDDKRLRLKREGTDEQQGIPGSRKLDRPNRFNGDIPF